MCGIVGMSFRDTAGLYRSDTTKIRNVFTNMLVSAQVRGAAATGVLLVGRKEKDSTPKAYILRSPLPAEDFVNTEEYKELLKNLNEHTLSVIGHTRAVSGNNATAENNRNNHPHRCGTIIGVHNGRVLNDENLWSKHSGYLTPKSRCDSEIIFALLARKLQLEPGRPIESALEDVLTEISGWFALAVVNAKEPWKVVLARDTESPLELAFWPTPEIAVFASEYEYISKAWDEECKHQTSLKRHVIPPNYTITLDSTVKGTGFADLFVKTRKLRNTNKNTSTIIGENLADYKATQGKRQA